MSVTKIDTHVADALLRLPSQHKDKTKIRGLVSALATPSQTLEDAIHPLLDGRFIATAEGAQLDQIGVIVGEPRADKVDADYRRFLSARIATNSSSGVINQLLIIAELIINDVGVDIELDNQGIATFVVKLTGDEVSDSVATVLARFMRDARAVGVRSIIEYQATDVANTFTWDDLINTWDVGIWTGAIE